MINIFQGNQQIRQIICQELEVEGGKHGDFFYTNKYYFQAFFYLTQRFGVHYKQFYDVATWSFKIKHYVIEIVFNDSFFYFIIFGNETKFNNRDQYRLWVKRNRNAKKYHNTIFDETTDFSKGEAKLFLDYFLKANAIESISEESFDAGYGDAFYEVVQVHNDLYLNEGVDKKIHTLEHHTNSLKNHALRTLRQFIRNLHTPVRLKDVNYNIRGVCGCEYNHYENNVKITCIEPKNSKDNDRQFRNNSKN